MADRASPKANRPEGRRAAPRAQLTRRMVVSAGVVLVDESGTPGLTMRRLAQRLGVEAMSLYAHVHGKENLLDAIVDQLLSELLDGDDPAWARSGRGWRDSLRQLAGGLRSIALLHPRAFHLVAYRPAAATWLRAPLQSVEWAERLLDRLVTEGFSDQDAVAVYRAYNAFLLGALLPEASRAERDERDEVGRARSPDHPSMTEPRDFPTVSRLEGTLSREDFGRDFQDSLTALLDGFAPLATAGRTNQAPRRRPAW